MKSNTKILNFKIKGGYLLIELMISISLLIAGFLGIIGIISNSLSLNRVVSDQFTANYLALEGIEVTKSMLDANYMRPGPWNRGVRDGCYDIEYNSSGLINNLNGFTCSDFSMRRPLEFNPATGIYDYSGTERTRFYRMIQVQQIDREGNPRPDEIQIDSIVRWVSRGGGIFEVRLEDHFFDWR
ncbi:MAG: hypothetical protein AAB596_02215 [Patescibacteria group bacterium]